MEENVCVKLTEPLMHGKTNEAQQTLTISEPLMDGEVIKQVSVDLNEPYNNGESNEAHIRSNPSNVVKNVDTKEAPTSVNLNEALITKDDSKSPTTFILNDELKHSESKSGLVHNRNEPTSIGECNKVEKCSVDGFEASHNVENHEAQGCDKLKETSIYVKSTTLQPSVQLNEAHNSVDLISPATNVPSDA